jgi:hypothetical protein
MSAFDRRALPSPFPLPARVPARAALVLALLALLPWQAGCRAHEATQPQPEAAADAPVARADEGPTPAATPTPAPAAVKAEPTPEADPAAKAEPPPKVDPAAKAEPGTLAPLTDEQLAILFGSTEDEVPEFRGGITAELSNLHYLSGNEKTLDAFYATLENVGGSYVGVGTDQAYFFMSWARFEIAWLIDYDPAVREVHELYRLFFLASATPQELVALWDEANRERAFAVIDAAHDDERAKQLRFWYRNSRARISKRLEKVGQRMTKVGVPCFLTDQGHYDYVRTMLEQRRVRPMLVDLHAEQGLLSLAASADKLGMPIRVLYLSNAEQYWKRYPKQYRANIAALHFAENGMVLRTLLSQSANVDYRYNVQPGANYQEWLSKPFVGNVYQIVRKGPKASPEGITFFETTDDPDDSPMGRRWHAKRGG